MSLFSIDFLITPIHKDRLLHFSVPRHLGKFIKIDVFKQRLFNILQYYKNYI